MNINRKTARILATWGIAMMINLATALLCVIFIFTPVKEHITTGGEEIIVKYSAYSLQGGALLSESWKEYPQYTIGLGTAGLLSFGGACFCAYNMKKKEVEPE